MTYMMPVLSDTGASVVVVDVVVDVVFMLVSGATTGVTGVVAGATAWAGGVTAVLVVA